MHKSFKSLLLPNRVDARSTVSGLRELARLAANEECPAIGMTFAVQFADDTVQYGSLGLAARNSDRAARLANQLADSLIWDKND